MQKETDYDAEYRITDEQLNWLKLFYTEVKVIDTPFIKLMLFSLQSFNDEFQKEFIDFIETLIVTKHTQIAKIIKSITDDARSVDAYKKYECAFTYFKELSHAAKYLLSYKNKSAKEIKLA